MSLGSRIIQAIERRRDRLRRAQPGASGRFWRDGGNELLYELPVTTGSVVIDGGGYKGQWTAGMLVRYGCSSHLYEPVPAYADQCRRLFGRNKLVTVYSEALAGSDRSATLNLMENGTSEFIEREATDIEVRAVDVARIIRRLEKPIACLKLNIEGGEYEVLERLSDTGQIERCECVLVQFHRQPADYRERYEAIIDALRSTHHRSWSYEMVWEKWVLRDGN